VSWTGNDVVTSSGGGADYTGLPELILITGLIVLLGAVIGYYAFRNYQRTQSRSMAFLGIGFLLISAGSAVSWWGFWALGWSAIECQLGTVGVSTVGFVAIIYSLRTRAG
jgi:Kef-type K+ transport system membrane component KefB